jgi:hypothetical protein
VPSGAQILHRRVKAIFVDRPQLSTLIPHINVSRPSP